MPTVLDIAEYWKRFDDVMMMGTFFNLVTKKIHKNSKSDS